MKTIRNKALVYFILVALVPLFLFGIISYRHSMSVLKKEIIKYLLTVAGDKTRIVESYFEEHINNARILAQDPAIIEAVEKAVSGDGLYVKDGGVGLQEAVQIKRFLTYFQINYGSEETIVTSLDGDVLFSANGDIAPGENIITGRYMTTTLAQIFAEGKRSAKTTISDYADYDSENRLKAFIVTPVKKHTKAMGFIVLKINADKLLPAIEANKGLGLTGEIFIIRKEGNRISLLNRSKHGEYPELAGNIDVSVKTTGFLSSSLKKHTGWEYSVDYRGKKVISAWKHMPSMQWIVFVKIDAEEAFMPIARLKKWFFIIGAFTLFLGFIAALIFSKALSDPIRSLQEGARIVEGGNLDYKVRLKTEDEIGDLSKAFDSMTETLKKTTVSRNELVKEIEEKELAQKILKDSEQRYCLAQKSAKTGSWDWDILSGHLDWSETMEPMFGIPEGSFDSSFETFLEYVHPEDREHVMASVKKSISEGREYDIEHRIIWPDGDIRWISERGNVFFDTDKKAVRMIGIVQDITDRKNSEETMRRMAEIVECSNDAILGWDMEGIVTSWNKGAEDLYGYKRDEIIGTSIFQLMPADKADEMKDIIEKIRKGEKLEHFETKRKNNKGKKIDVALTVSPIKDSSGKITGASAIARDISKDKRAEKAMHEAAELKAAFTSMVSHELRTPLGPIREGASIILDGLTGKINEQQKDLLETVRRNADRLNRLINDVLDYQKIDSGRMKFAMKRHKLQEVIEEVYKTMKISSDEKGLEFKLDIQKDMPDVLMDRDRITQVLTNLVNNAVKFTGKGTIGIRAKSEQNTATIEVWDTGYGIKDEEMPKLFQSFQQLEAAKELRVKGTGLGLVICKEIVEMHNGTIWAESRFQKGSSFYFTLPVQ